MIRFRKRVSFRNFKKGNYTPDSIAPAYTLFSKFYDETMFYLNYPVWRDYILKLTRYFDIQGTSLLELASGTGHLAKYLSGHFMVTPSDNSGQMLEKLKNNYPKFKPLKLNMCSFELEEKYNVVVSFNDNVNYIKAGEELQSHFNSVKNVLKPSGLYIFDTTPMFNIKKNFLGVPLCLKTKAGFFRWENFLNEQEKSVHSHVDMLEIGKDKIIREIHKQKIHDADLLISLLLKTGFKKVYHFEGFTMTPPIPKSEHYHFAALV